jgi:hypothetical protein
MACQASFGIVRFHLFVAFDTGIVGWFVRPRYHLLVNDVAVTVHAFELCLLNVHPVGYLNLIDDLLFLFLNILVTADAILIDECVPRGELMGKDLTRLRMTVDATHAGRVDGLTPHLDPRLTHVAVEAYSWIRHENVPCEKDKGNPQDDDTWKDAEEKPFLLEEIQNGMLYEV